MNKEKKTIYIPKAIHDLMGPDKMTPGQIENIITLISLAQDKGDRILKSGKVETKFTVEEYSKRRQQINTGEYLISVIDEIGHKLTKEDLGWDNAK